MPTSTEPQSQPGAGYVWVGFDVGSVSGLSSPPTDTEPFPRLETEEYFPTHSEIPHSDRVSRIASCTDEDIDEDIEDLDVRIIADMTAVELANATLENTPLGQFLKVFV